MTEPVAALASSLPDAIVQRDVSLAALSRWRIGGKGALLVEPRDSDEVALTLVAVAAHGVPYIVVGDTSNLLFDDAGFKGALIRIGRRFSHFRLGADGEVDAGAGLWVPCFVRRLIDAGLSGATHAIGIPGTLGGLVTMNGGSQRKGIGEQLVSADVIDADGRRFTMDHDEMGFAYRTSAVQQSGLIVLGARFRYSPGDKAVLHAEALRILGDRRRKFPRVKANCGSVFVSDPALYERIGPPGMAIELVGLRGYRIGDAELSADHANFIVNHGTARSADVLALIHKARQAVHRASGVAMLAEVRHVRPDGAMIPAHVSADLMDLEQGV